MLEGLIWVGGYPQIRPTPDTLSDKEKRQAAKWLQEYWKAQREAFAIPADRESSAYWAGFAKGLPATPLDHCARWVRLVIANAVVARSAKEALAIPLPQHLRGWRSMYPVAPEAKQALLEAIAAKGEAWVADYLQLGTSGKRVEQVDIPLTVALILGFHQAWPQREEFYRLWAEHFRSFSPTIFPHIPYAPSAPVLHVDPATQLVAPLAFFTAHSYLEAASRLPALETLIAELLTRPDEILALLQPYAGTEEQDMKVKLIADLVDAGHLDRTALIERLLAALTRGDSVSAQRLQARLLLAVGTDSALISVHANVLLGLLASAHGSAAGAAQSLLRRVDEDKALSGEYFINTCEMVFARKEKGLRDDQLAWVGQRFAALPAQAGASMTGLFAALGVEDLSFQKKVAAQITKHWPLLAATDQASLSPLLANYQAVLESGIYQQLAAVLGASTSPVPNSVPEMYVAQVLESRPVTRFSVPPASAAALRELQAQFPNNASVNACEQVICMALELAESDHHALKLGMHSISTDFPFGLLYKLQQAAFGQLKVSAAVERFSWDTSDFARIVHIARLRYHEIATAIQQGTPYPLISRPDYSNGAIDAASLTARLDQLARQGQDAPPMDFLVALLRTRQPDENGIALLRAVASTQARISADFFAAGGLSQMQTRWHHVQGEGPQDFRSALWLAPDHPEICVSLQGMATLPAIEGVDSLLPRGFTPETAKDVWEFDHAEGFRTSVLPDHAEILAALALWGFRKAGHDSDSSGGKAAALALSVYLAARGPAGPALHLAVLFTLSANDAAARLAGSDGLLELIAQERYVSTLACELVAACVECGTVKIARLAKSLAPLVDAGAGDVLWPLLRAALVAALAQASPPPGTPDLLALVSRVAAGLGLRETIAVLAEVAARRGSSKLLTEARRLNEVLTG